MKNPIEVGLVIAIVAFFVLGFVAAKPACPERSVPMFVLYDGGWFCLATVEQHREN